MRTIFQILVLSTFACHQSLAQNAASQSSIDATDCDAQTVLSSSAGEVRYLDRDSLDGSLAVMACEKSFTANPADAALQFKLGRAYEKVGQLEKAKQLYQRSSNLGFAAAQERFAVVLLESGGGADADKQAAELLRKAVQQGSASAKANLAILYERGQGVPKDLASALRLTMEAAEAGNVLAQANLAAMFGQGRIVAQNYALSNVWFRRAASQGDSAAQYALGYSYEHGRGIVLDKERAVYWYKKAADQGNADAQYGLGLAYYKGEGVTESDAEAVAWFRRSADQNNPAAVHALGNMYALGRGVSRNEGTAIDLYRKGAGLGYGPSKVALDDLVNRVIRPPKPGAPVDSFTNTAPDVSMPEDEQRDTILKSYTAYHTVKACFEAWKGSFAPVVSERQFELSKLNMRAIENATTLSRDAKDSAWEKSLNEFGATQDLLRLAARLGEVDFGAALNSGGVRTACVAAVSTLEETAAALQPKSKPRRDF